MKKGETIAHAMKEMGAKLANFRRKLEILLNVSITQKNFGKMFGGYTVRAIGSYEAGENQVPGLLLYNIWNSGYSIDSLFDEGPIVQEARVRKKETPVVNILTDAVKSVLTEHLLNLPGYATASPERQQAIQAELNNIMAKPKDANDKTKPGRGRRRSTKTVKRHSNS